MIQLRTTSIAVAVILSFLVAPTDPKRASGEWYMIPKGLTPRIIKDHSVNQNVVLITPDKDKPQEKLVDAQFEFTRKIGPLGAQIELYQRGCADDKWLAPDIINASDICDIRIPKLQEFWTCFSGKLNDDCTVNPGNYTLKTWNLEKELHTFFDQLEYKCYKIRFCFYDEEEQKVRPAGSDELMCVWVVEVRAQIEDEELKGKNKRKIRKKSDDD